MVGSRISGVGAETMSKSIRTYVDQRETRRDRRYLLPPVTVTFDDVDYSAVNWSLGGCLLANAPRFDLGAQISGLLRIGGEMFPITAETVRRDRVAKTMAFRFVAPTAAMVGALDRAVARRLSGRRPQ